MPPDRVLRRLPGSSNPLNHHPAEPVFPPIKLSSPHTREFWEIPVLYEDDHLLAVDKPAGLLSSPDRYDPQRPNLMRLLHEGIAQGKAWATARGLTYLANVHRLDFETSGVLLLAKTRETLVQLARQFELGNPEKQYVALIHGEVNEETFRVEVRLAPDPREPQRILVVRKRGKLSVTEFRVRERYRGYTLLECRPLTGRTHQIRVHLAHRQWPVVGDKLYGGQPLYLSRIKPGYRFKRGEPERPLLSRLALHAERLQFLHPVSGQPVSIEAPWPRDLEAAVKQLRRYAALSPVRHEGPGG